jgi:hypothetical protein
MLSKNDFWPRREEEGFKKEPISRILISSILDFGFYYYPFPQVERALADFFDSIGPFRPLL